MYIDLTGEVKSLERKKHAVNIAKLFTIKHRKKIMK